MKCTYCAVERRRFLPHFCDPRAVAARHRRVPESVVLTQEEVLGGTSGAGWAATVYAEYYVKSSPIYAAVRKRANAVVRAPLLVYQRRGDKLEQAPETHPLQQLLDHVNPWWTSGDMWRATSTYLDLWGSAYWLLSSSTDSPEGGGGRPRSIWLLRSDRVEVVPDPAAYVKAFRYRHDRVTREFAPDEIVWFRHVNPLHETAGLSPVAVARLDADMALDATRYNREVFRNSPLIDNVVFKADGATPDEIEDFQARLKARYSGAAQARRPLVVSDVEPQNLGLNARDLEWVASLRWSLETVARVFEVPKILLEDLERSTYANVDAAERIFWRSIASYMQFLQGELNEMLCPRFGEGLRVEFDLSEIEALQPNMNDVHERLRQDVAAGILTVNEARADLGLERVSWGDTWWAPLNIVPVEGAEAGGERVFRSADALDRCVEAHVKRLDKHEVRFAELQRGLFRKQRQSVVAALGRLAQDGYVDGQERLLASRRKQLPADIFDLDAWNRDFAAAGLPHVVSALVDEAEAQVAHFGLGIAFDVQQPPVQEWVRERTAFWAQRVNEETARLVTQEIEAAVANGETIRQVQERVGNVFATSDAVRTERIARTEMNAASNRGALESYRQSGVTESKMWLTAVDGREREHHREVDRQTVPIDAPFIVMGERIMAPGEGSAANAIN